MDLQKVCTLKVIEKQEESANVNLIVIKDILMKMGAKSKVEVGVNLAVMLMLLWK